MAARLNKLHTEEIRTKIKTSQLLNVLQDHAFGHSEELSQSRMKAIEILLRKSLSDLSAVTISGDAENPLHRLDAGVKSERRRPLGRRPHPAGDDAEAASPVPGGEVVAANAGDDGGLLIGIDLVKDEQVLSDAYDDALGVTGAFNLNMLLHVNRLLGSDFDVRAMVTASLSACCACARS